MNMSELEMFWHQETDIALMDCWREAIATWCDHGILTMIKHPQSDTIIQFTEPWHVEIIQSMINPARLKALYLQAALALIDCYENPTMYQAWHIAELMEKANETSAFFQYFQQTIDLAYREAQLHFGSECIKHLIQILKKYTPPFSQDIICAVDWPYTLELCADICLRQDDYDQFNYLDKILQHLTQDKNIYTAMHAYLQAIYFLRRNNIQRSQDSADSAIQIFESCNEDAQAAKARIIKAEAAMKTGDFTMAKQLLAKAQPILSAQNIYWHVARIENMLALTDWYPGQIKHAERHIQQSLQLFRLSHYKLDLCLVQAHACMMNYFSGMDVKQITELKELLEILEEQGDTQILANIKVFYYLANVLADQWTEIEEASKLYADIEQIGPHDSIITGAVTCFMAMKNAIQGNPSAARNDITMSIASFGPQNRRARAWCHTLLGTIDILTSQMESGTQSFQRAEKDFQILDDQFGLIAVKIAQSALLLSCKKDALLWSSALETLHDAKSSAWPMMTTLARILFIQAAMDTSQPASILNMLETEQPAVIPEVLRPFCIDILANAIAHYSEDKPSDTQYLFQLYEAISPEADLMMEDNDFPEVDIF